MAVLRPTMKPAARTHTHKRIGQQPLTIKGGRDGYRANSCEGEAMNEKELKEIEEKQRRVDRKSEGDVAEIASRAALSDEIICTHVPKLIAEVRRLQKEIDNTAQAELAENHAQDIAEVLATGDVGPGVYYEEEP